MNPGTFIAIVEAMIFRDSVTQPSSLIKDCRIQFHPVETLKRRMNGRLQKRAVMNPGMHDRILSNILMKIKDIHQQKLYDCLIIIHFPILYKADDYVLPPVWKSPAFLPLTADIARC